MQIRKEYKFYYAHRNQDLVGSKCQRPHGHDCHLFLTFNVRRNGNITTLFDDFDKKIEPFLKDEFDHRMIIDGNDLLYSSLLEHEQKYNEDLGLKVIPFPSSVENVCFFLFYRIKLDFLLDLDKIEFQETRSSTVIYTQDDYMNDLNSELGKKLVSFLIGK